MPVPEMTLPIPISPETDDTVIWFAAFLVPVNVAPASERELVRLYVPVPPEPVPSEAIVVPTGMEFKESKPDKNCPTASVPDVTKVTVITVLLMLATNTADDALFDPTNKVLTAAHEPSAATTAEY
jgi:hypothetical protein